MADLTLPEVITRFRGNEARITDFANGNAAGYYITFDGKKVETLPSVVSRLAAAIAAASATRNDLAAAGGAKLIGYGTTTVDAALAAQAKGIAENAKAITDLDTAKLGKAGGTMTGALKLAGDPTDPLHAATKGWAEALAGTYWKPGIGDVLTTVRGAPDSTWVPDGANYLQASYPDLFAKLGLIDADNTSSGWTKLATVTNSGMALFGKDGVIVATVPGSGGIIQRSTDNGATFTQVLSVSNPLTALDTDKAGVWIVAGSGGVYRSTDNGLTWTAITAGVTGTVNSLGTDRKGVWIAGVQNSVWVLKSKDNGLTWAKITTPYIVNTQATNRTGIWLVSTTNADIGMRSTDNGDTWTQVPILAGLNTTSIVAYGGGAFVAFAWLSGNTSYAYYSASVDGLNGWTSRGQSITSAQPYSIAIDDRGLGWVVCYTGTHFKLTVGVSAGAATLGVTSVNTSSGPGAYVAWPIRVATDGNYTWLCLGGSGGELGRSSPTYDVKTTFKVPKASTPNAPYANFIKAK